MLNLALLKKCGLMVPEVGHNLIPITIVMLETSHEHDHLLNGHFFKVTPTAYNFLDHLGSPNHLVVEEVCKEVVKVGAFVTNSLQNYKG